jgi:hypothetical protein
VVPDTLAKQIVMLKPHLLRARERDTDKPGFSAADSFSSAFADSAQDPVV